MDNKGLHILDGELFLNGEKVGSASADGIAYDNTNSGLGSDTAQGAIDELKAMIGDSGSNPFSGKKVGFIGDSFTIGGTWVSKMCALLGVSYINKAISGGRWSYNSETPYYSALTCSRNLYTQYNSLGVNPDYIIALYGVNDYGNTIPVGTINYNSISSQAGNSESQIASNIITHYSASSETVSSGIQSAIAYLQFMFPNAIIMLGWTPAGQQYMRNTLSIGGGWDNDIKVGQTTYIAANKYITRLQQLALMHGVRYINTFNCGINPWLEDHRSIYQTSSNDAHPYTEAAGTRIAQYMARLLLKEA